MSEPTRDVIVIGGGPAGSCAANLLAQAGLDALVLERERFPRFHIGESLLPTELAILARLGVDLDDHPHLRKRGAIFIDERNGVRQTQFSFDEGLPGTGTHAHQVERAQFDLELLRAAARAGAQVREGHEVLDVELGPELVELEVRERDGGRVERLRARYLVDATGQKALLGRRHKTLEPHRGLGRAAAFRHFRGLSAAAIAELHERGDVIIKIVDDGWMWGIPMISGEFSVGLVLHTNKLEPALLELEIARSPLLSRLTEGASATPIQLVGNFSYRNTRPHGRRFACIGDAACFLDPLFSSGVVLALAAAERFADLLIPAFAAGREHEEQLMDPLAAHMDKGYEVFSRFVYRVYHTRLADNILLTQSHAAHALRSGVISVLAGDVWRDDNPFQTMLLQARRI